MPNRFYAFIRPMKRKRRTLHYQLKAKATINVPRLLDTAPNHSTGFTMRKRKTVLRPMWKSILEWVIWAAILSVFAILFTAVVLAMLALLLHGVSIAR